MAARTYLTVDDLVARLGGEEADQLLGTGLRGTRSVDRGRAAAELAHVDSVIEGYVRARYPRGFAAVPAVLAGIAYDLVRYRLRSQGGQSSAMAQTVKDRNDEAMKLLRDVADGRVSIDVEGDGNQPAPGAHAETVRARFPAARMTDNLKGWL